MTDVVTQDKDVVVEVQQPTIPPYAPPPRIGLVEINQVVQRGTAWLTGSGTPSAAGGQYGDMYLDTTTGDMYQWNGTSWKYVGTFAPATLTPAQILASLITVDGAGSALDADLLDGQHGVYYAKQTDMTAVQATNTTQDSQIAAAQTSINVNAGAITDLQNTKANINNPTFTGDPKAPTPSPGDNDTSLATTAFVTNAIGTSNAGGPWAPVANPTFTGDPRAPTPTAGDNDTSIATTAFVTAAVGAANAGGPWAPVANPTFTGDPKAPTPATTDNDTSIATTAFVKNVVAGLPPSGIPDAPADGLTYGRKNNAWATIVGGSIVSDTAPTGTLQNGQTWWESDTGNLYIYYNDGDSSQWVMIASGNPAMPPVAGDLDMKGFSIINDLNITGTGTATFGAVTATGNVFSGQNFISNSANAVLAATGAGQIILRPNGPASTVGQVTLGTNGGISTYASAAANSQVAYCDETGAVRGYTYWNRGDNTMRLLNNTGGGAVIIDSAAVTTMSGNIRAGNPNGGYQCKAGNTGGYGGNNFNLRWNGASATELWIDNTMTGGITVSDYRIKKDVADLPSTWDKVKALRPISYSIKDYEKLSAADDTPQWGFIAHELQETLLMSASTGVKDEENVLQSPNWMPVVAALTKTIQEMQARIEALEAR